MRKFAIPMLAVLLLAAQCSPADGLGASLEVERGILVKLKTAYLFNLAKFVSWPESRPLVQLCIHADSPVRRFARELDGRPLGDGRELRLSVIADSTGKCDIVFDDSEPNSGPNIAVVGSHYSAEVLTISDSPDAIRSGFAVQLFLESEKLRFAINTDAVKSANYRISSKLMRLARTPGTDSQ